MSGRFTRQEAAALRLIQEAFPLTSRPFAEIGATVGLSEHEVIDLLKDLKQRNLLKEIRGIFSGKATPRILVRGSAFRSLPDVYREIGADGFAYDLRSLTALL